MAETIALRPTEATQNKTEHTHTVEEAPLPQLREMLLKHNEVVPIDINFPVDVVHNGRDDLFILASIKAGDSNFHLIRTQDNQNKHSVYLIEQEVYEFDRIARDPYGPQPGLIRIPKDTVMPFGRNHEYGDTFDYSRRTSRDHFMIQYADDPYTGEESIQLINLEPTHQTEVEAYQIVESESKPQVEGRTVKSQDRIRFGRPEDYRPPDRQAPYGYYKNHQILGRQSSSVMDGVYLGGSAREAIVVNAESPLLQSIYNQLAIELVDKVLADQSILESVKDTVQAYMPYDSHIAEMVGADSYDDELVDLDKYIEAGGGVCRHHELFSAYLIERLIIDGKLRGTVGVERNTVHELGGTHGWAVFKPEQDPHRPIVVDAAQSYVGTKERAKREKRWRYQLATDTYR